MITIAVCIIFCLLVLFLYKEWLAPALSFFIAALLLHLLGVLPAVELLKGFSNPSIANILLLIIFGNLLGHSALIGQFFSKTFLKTGNYQQLLYQLLPTVTGLSAFVNNTPIVALLIPYLNQWAKRHKIALSKLLIPLSFAAILGGTISLVGTSTNMLVNAYAKTHANIEFALFDFAWVGLPVAIIGLGYILIFAKKYLPVRETLTENFEKNNREYLVEAEVHSASKMINKSIKQSNLRKLNGLFVVEIIRNNNSIAPVSPNDVLQEGDVLILAGNVHAITELIDKNEDLKLPKFSQLNTANNHLLNVTEVVVSRNNQFQRKTVKDSDFRRKYNAALVAIRRGGQYLKGKLGDKQLKAGDSLLLLTGDDFEKTDAVKKDFYTISSTKQRETISTIQSLFIAAGLIFSITLSSLSILPLFTCLITLLVISLLTKTITIEQLNKFTDYNLLVIAALALSLGYATEAIGLAENIAIAIVKATSTIGPLGALVGIYVITFILTELMTNIAAASLALPFGLAVANQLGLQPEPFLLAIAYAASASFITPIGYQTNLMVYGPGGYQFKDFIKFGLPLSIIYCFVAITILYWRYF